MATHSKFWPLAVIGIAASVGVLASLAWHRPAAPDLTTGSFLAPSRALPDFSLIDQRGKAYGSANLRGHWSLLFFGYTNCPDFCPTTLTTLAAMEKRLRAVAGQPVPQVLFVSVDAARDTPEQLAKYVPNFDPEFIGLTAPDQPGAEAFAKKLNVAVAIRPISEGVYFVDHTGAIFVLNPDGRLSAVLTGPFTVDALQSDFQRIVAAGGVLAGRT